MVSNQIQDIGDVLLSQDVITEEQLQMVRGHQAKNPIATHRLILDLNLASEKDTLETLAGIHSVEFKDLSGFIIPQKILEAIPLKLIFHYRFVPLELTPDTVTMA